jgi:hypothetical protein
MHESQTQFIEEFMSKNRNFAMFSSKGNRRVQAFVKKCMKKIFGKAMRQKEFEAYVSAEAKKVASQEAYAEISDTAVRECIYWWLEKAIEKADYDWGSDFEYSCW